MFLTELSKKSPTSKVCVCVCGDGAVREFLEWIIDRKVHE